MKTPEAALPPQLEGDHALDRPGCLPTGRSRRWRTRGLELRGVTVLKSGIDYARLLLSLEAVAAFTLSTDLVTYTENKVATNRNLS